MPTNTRTHLRRKLANAIHDLDLVVTHLIELYEIFGEHHADLQEYLDIQITGLLQIKEMMLDFWARAWGARPDDYERWR